MDLFRGIRDLLQIVQDAVQSHLSEDSSDGEEDNPLLYYYALARALRRGDANSHRPGLPTELVITIFDYLEVKNSIVEKTSAPFSVYDGNHVAIAVDTKRLLPSIGRLHLQLTTKSHDQGWVSDPNAGNWTWFDIFIWKAKHSHQGPKSYEWISHYNELASSTTTELQGPVFDPSHPLWTHLETGDYITARANACYPGWRNHVEEMKLEIWEPFDPTRFG